MSPPNVQDEPVDVSSLTIVAPSSEGAAVHYAVRELCDFCAECANVETRVRSFIPKNPDGPLILVGRSAVRRNLGEDALSRLGIGPKLGDEGFVLKVARKRPHPIIVAAGHTKAGTRWAVLEFIKSLDITGRQTHLSLPLPGRRVPQKKLRGMYAHQHWSYRYPYALRTWDASDWKRYLDILSYFGFNHIQIWSMSALLPVPYSPQDARFLDRYNEAIAHAHDNHGMTVWIGECSNNTCQKAGLPPPHEREYFACEERLNPGDPDQFKQLMRIRAEFYKAVPDADGYWVLAVDPGGWEGSPSSEYIDILVGNRTLVDKYASRGVGVPLIQWMWVGWGTKDDRMANCADVVDGILERLTPPYRFTVAFPAHFEMMRRRGLLADSVFFPYGAIEPEPSMPFTDPLPERLYDSIRAGEEQEAFSEMMGNAQSPLVQLPNIFAFGLCAWDAEALGAPREDVLFGLGRLVFPRSAEALCRGWLALADPDADDAEGALRQLRTLLKEQKLGPPGPVGRKITPRADLVVDDLCLMLEVHVRAARFRRACADSSVPDAEALRVLSDYILRLTAWRCRTGFKRFAGDPVTFRTVHLAVYDRWGEGAGGGELPAGLLDPLRERIEAEYDAAEADFIIGTFGFPPRKAPA